MFKRLIASIIILCFSCSMITIPKARAEGILNLPVPGSMINLSAAYEPTLIKGVTINKDNPFLFDFILDPGNSNLTAKDPALKIEADRLIKYFFASMTIPEKDIWVNLSPYEKDRMIPDSLGKTELGRDLLAQDYLLKQITASLIYPEKGLGKTFWNKVYAKAQEMYGTSEIPVNTFNKVWIVADKASVFEHGQTAFMVDGHLKVMLEEDYLALSKNVSLRAPAGGEAIFNRTTRAKKIASLRPSDFVRNDTSVLGSQIVREIVVPALEKEVNEGKNFAQLRQIFYSQVLATWFKRNLKQALLTQVYANKSTVKGIDQNDTKTNETIYQQYLKAYKKGVFNYIKDDSTPTGETIPRKYFSGGYDSEKLNISRAMSVPEGSLRRGQIRVTTALLTGTPTSENPTRAMTTQANLFDNFKQNHEDAFISTVSKAMTTIEAIKAAWADFKQNTNKSNRDKIISLIESIPDFNLSSSANILLSNLKRTLIQVGNFSTDWVESKLDSILTDIKRARTKAIYGGQMKDHIDDRVLGAHLFKENGLLYIGDNTTQKFFTPDKFKHINVENFDPTVVEATLKAYAESEHGKSNLKQGEDFVIGVDVSDALMFPVEKPTYHETKTVGRTVAREMFAAVDGGDVDLTNLIGSKTLEEIGTTLVRLTDPKSMPTALLLPKYDAIRSILQQTYEIFGSHEMALAKKVSEQLRNQPELQAEFMENFKTQFKIFSAVRRADVGAHIDNPKFNVRKNFTAQGLNFEDYKQQLIDDKVLDESGEHVIAPLAKRYELWTKALSWEGKTILRQSDLDAIAGEMVLNQNFVELDRSIKKILGVNPVYQIVSGNLREVMLAGSFQKQALDAGIRLDDEIIAPSLKADAAMTSDSIREQFVKQENIEAFYDLLKEEKYAKCIAFLEGALNNAKGQEILIIKGFKSEYFSHMMRFISPLFVARLHHQLLNSMNQNLNAMGEIISSSNEYEGKIQSQWEQDLRSNEFSHRRKAAKMLSEMIERGYVAAAPLFEENNVHVHSVFSYSPYYPEEIVYRAKRAGLRNIGIIDHDTLDGVKDFLVAGDIFKIKVTTGGELRIRMSGKFKDVHLQKTDKTTGQKVKTVEDVNLQTAILNNPGVGGMAYFLAHAIPDPNHPVIKAFFQRIRDSKDKRNRRMIEDVNKKLEREFHLQGISVDYNKNVVPLTQNGNATDRHLMAALAIKLGANLNSPQLVDLYRNLLQRDLKPQEISAIEATRGFAVAKEDLDVPMELLRAGFLKPGTIFSCYIEPDEKENPTLEETVEAVTKAGGIPVYPYLGDEAKNGNVEENEDFLDKFFAYLKEKGVLGVAIMPHRNEEKVEIPMVIRLAKKHGLMVFSGVDINKATAPFLEKKALAALYPDFKAGGDFLVGHEFLSRYAAGNEPMGYLGSGLIKFLPNQEERRNFLIWLGNKSFEDLHFLRLSLEGVTDKNTIVENLILGFRREKEGIDAKTNPNLQPVSDVGEPNQAMNSLESINNPTRGGIDLSNVNRGMTITKDEHGGIKVNFNPAMITHIRQEGVLPSAVPFIIRVETMTSEDIRPLLGLAPVKEEQLAKL